MMGLSEYNLSQAKEDLYNDSIREYPHSKEHTLNFLVVKRHHSGVKDQKVQENTHMHTQSRTHTQMIKQKLNIYSR